MVRVQVESKRPNAEAADKDQTPPPTSGAELLKSARDRLKQTPVRGGGTAPVPQQLVPEPKEENMKRMDDVEINPEANGGSCIDVSRVLVGGNSSCGPLDSQKGSQTKKFEKLPVASVHPMRTRSRAVTSLVQQYEQQIVDASKVPPVRIKKPATRARSQSFHTARSLSPLTARSWSFITARSVSPVTARNSSYQLDDGRPESDNGIDNDTETKERSVVTSAASRSPMRSLCDANMTEGDHLRELGELVKTKCPSTPDSSIEAKRREIDELFSRTIALGSDESSVVVDKGLIRGVDEMFAESIVIPGAKPIMHSRPDDDDDDKTSSPPNTQTAMNATGNADMKLPSPIAATSSAKRFWGEAPEFDVETGTISYPKFPVSTSGSHIVGLSTHAQKQFSQDDGPILVKNKEEDKYCLDKRILSSEDIDAEGSDSVLSMPSNEPEDDVHCLSETYALLFGPRASPSVQPPSSPSDTHSLLYEPRKSPSLESPTVGGNNETLSTTFSMLFGTNLSPSEQSSPSGQGGNFHQHSETFNLLFGSNSEGQCGKDVESELCLDPGVLKRELSNSSDSNTKPRLMSTSRATIHMMTSDFDVEKAEFAQRTMNEPCNKQTIDILAPRVTETINEDVVTMFDEKKWV